MGSRHLVIERPFTTPLPEPVTLFATVMITTYGYPCNYGWQPIYPPTYPIYSGSQAATDLQARCAEDEWRWRQREERKRQEENQQIQIEYLRFQEAYLRSEADRLARARCGRQQVKEADADRPAKSKTSSFQQLIYDSWRIGPHNAWSQPDLPPIPFPNDLASAGSQSHPEPAPSAAPHMTQPVVPSATPPIVVQLASTHSPPHPQPQQMHPQVSPDPPRDRAPFQDILQYTQLLTGDRECYVCHRTLSIELSVAYDSYFTPHAGCSDRECPGNQCLGCSKPNPECPADCEGGDTCPRSDLSCCSEVRAMRILSILSDFERKYLQAAARICQWESGKEHYVPLGQRMRFIRSMTTDQHQVDEARKWNNFLRHYTKEINQCLLPEEPSHVIHASVKSLLSNSFLLEAMHAFLETASPFSVSDMGVYAEITRFLGLVSNRPCLEELVQQSRPAIRFASNIFSRIQNPTGCIWELEEQVQYSLKELLTSRSMLALLDDLDNRSEGYLRTVASNLRLVVDQLSGRGRPVLP